MTHKHSRSALVTGASGYIGAHLARRLVADGWDVHVLARPASALTALAQDEGAVTVHRHGGTTAELVDILSQAAPDAVFHLGAAFVAEHKPEDVDTLVQANLLFATQLLEAMRVNGVRLLVNTGTAWQHFGNRDYDPVNLYAATKQAFEAILTYYVNAHGFSAATLVLFDTYGPDDPRPKLMGALWKAAHSGEPLAMTSGEQLLDLVHVDDVAQAFLAAERSLRGAAPGHARYGVSSGETLSLREVVARFEEASGRRLAVRWGVRAGRARDVLVSVTGLAPPPSWRPEVALDEGIRRCAPAE